MTLANLDQALRMILADEVKKTSVLRADAIRAGVGAEKVCINEALEAMRRAYRLAESKEEMMKMIGEPGAPQA